MTNINHTTLYVGMTNNLVRRVQEHKDGTYKVFTQRYNLTKLVYYECGDSIEGCILREDYLKRCYRKTKEKLINSFNPNWVDLSDKISHEY